MTSPAAPLFVLACLLTFSLKGQHSSAAKSHTPSVRTIREPDIIIVLARKPIGRRSMHSSEDYGKGTNRNPLTANKSARAASGTQSSSAQTASENQPELENVGNDPDGAASHSSSDPTSGRENRDSVDHDVGIDESDESDESRPEMLPNESGSGIPSWDIVRERNVDSSSSLVGAEISGSRPGLARDWGTLQDSGPSLVRARRQISRSNLVRDESQISRSNLVRDESQISRSNLARDASQISRSNLARDESQISRSNLDRDDSQISRSNLVKDESQISRSNLARDESQISRSNLVRDESQISRSKLIRTRRQNSRSPIVRDESQNSRSPLVREERQNSRSPLVRDESQNSTSPLVRDESQNSTSPLVKDESQNSRSSLVRDERQNSTSPLMRDESQNSISPLVKDESQNSRSNLARDKSQHSRPKLVRTRRENSRSLEVRDESQTSRSPLVRDESQDPRSVLVRGRGSKGSRRQPVGAGVEGGRSRPRPDDPRFNSGKAKNQSTPRGNTTSTLGEGRNSSRNASQRSRIEFSGKRLLGAISRDSTREKMNITNKSVGKSTADGTSEDDVIVTAILATFGALVVVGVAILVLGTLTKRER